MHPHWAHRLVVNSNLLFLYSELGSLDHWPAMQKWKSREGLMEQFGEGKEVTVNLTPTGRGKLLLVVLVLCGNK